MFILKIKTEISKKQIFERLIKQISDDQQHQVFLLSEKKKKVNF